VTRVRVAMVVSQYPPVIGGTERFCHRLSAGLVRRGHTVDVLTRCHGDEPSKQEMDGVRVHRLGTPHAAGPTYVMAATAWLIANRNHYDLVHCHQALSPAIIGSLAGCVTGCPVITKVACSGINGEMAYIRNRLFFPLRRRLLVRGTAGFTCLSAEMDAEVCETLGRVRTWRLGNGIDTAAHAPLPVAERAALRTQLGLTGPTVLFTGALRAQKNLPLLIEAVAGLPAEVRLDIVGTGPDEGAARAAVERHRVVDRVRFVGPVADVRPYLRAADLFVLPSVAEGMSNSLLEAMAAGLPVVATAIPANAALLREGENSLLFPSGDAAALRSALAALLADRDLRQRFGAAARAYIVERFDLERVIDRYLEIYQQILSQRRG
jgi:glycosyltransferase involved in cell wall biosynthesis